MKSSVCFPGGVLCIPSLGTTGRCHRKLNFSRLSASILCQVESRNAFRAEMWHISSHTDTYTSSWGHWGLCLEWVKSGLAPFPSFVRTSCLVNQVEKWRSWNCSPNSWSALHHLRAAFLTPWKCQIFNAAHKFWELHRFAGVCVEI